MWEGIPVGFNDKGGGGIEIEEEVEEVDGRCPVWVGTKDGEREENV